MVEIEGSGGVRKIDWMVAPPGTTGAQGVVPTACRS